MDLKYMEIFLAIVEHRSITKAAESLFISQSTVSYRLSALEKEVNAVLIDRGKGINQISLTAKGRDFLPIAQRWFSLYKDTSHFKLVTPAYPLRLAGSESINNYILRDLYNEIAANEENVNLIIYTSQSKDVYNLLESREIDVGFAYIPSNHDHCKAEAICEREMVLVEKSAVIRANPSVTPKDLDPALEIYVKSPSINVWRDKWFDQSAIPYVWVDTPVMIQNFLNREGCWCIVPESMADFLAEKPDVHIYSFSDPPPNLICYMATHRFPKPSTVDAMHIIEKYISLIK